MSVGRPPRDFRLIAPEGWFDVDLDPPTMFETIDRLVDERLTQAPAAEPRRDEILAIARRGVTEAAAAGAFRAWFFSDVIDGRPVSASLTATVARLEDASVDGRGPRGVAERLAQTAASSGTRAKLAATELPAGPAVRLRRHVEAPAAGRATKVGSVSVQYFLAIPSTRSVLLLSFATPNLALEEPFLALFDSIVATLRWVEPAEAAP
ncbi:MAG: hypothetical protein ACRD29_22415 [Acidimicrobiales bacterium]